MGTLRDALRDALPGPRAWRGAASGVALVGGALYLYSGAMKIAAPTPNWAGVPALLGLVGAFGVPTAVAALAVKLLFRKSRLRAGLPRFVLVLAIPVALGWLLERDGVPRRTTIATVLFVVGMAAAAGAGLAVVAGKPGTTARRRRIARVGLAVGLGGLALFGGWLSWDGPAAAPDTAPAFAAASAPVAAAAPVTNAAASLPDPTATGPFRTRTLTYGSGADRHRPEFGAGAALRTLPVDGRPFLRRWSGLSGEARTRYHGFDASALPLQAHLSLPEGEGPFPVVVCVHGNHLAEDPSSAGYAYFGDVLASRGFVFVSVDQSFLNESLADITSGHTEALVGENAARAWLLLQHLKVLRKWSRETGHLLHGKLDLDRVALIGHSRGGEAALVAAAWNPLPKYPDDPAVPFDFRFGIRAVIALAPVDGQYAPEGIPTRLKDASYLVLQGNLDADVGSFQGAKALQRVDVTRSPEAFKAAVFIDRAGHAQFNTVWGRRDLGGLAGRFLATTPLLPAAEQQRITTGYLAAFLEATLLGKRAYRALFRANGPGAPWLPDVPVWRQYGDGGTRLVATFDEDEAPATATLAGASIRTSGLTDWHEAEPPMKSGTLGTRVAWLAWSDGPRPDGELAPSFTVALPKSFRVSPRAALSMHLAVPRQASSAPIDLTVELVDRAGITARLPLGRAGVLRRPPDRGVWKPPARDDYPSSDTVLQLFELPLQAFVEVAAGLDPARLASVRLVFDRTAAGAVLVDDVGFREEPEGN